MYLLKIFLLIAFFHDSIGAKNFTENDIADAIVEVSNEYNIEPSILYTLVSIESDFEPMAIAVETSLKSARVLTALKSHGIKVVFGESRRTFHSKRSVISIYPDDLETANYIIKLLEKNGFCFDVGLMQINTVNFTLSEVGEMFLPDKNLEKAAEVYSVCKKRFSQTKHRVECYNRGAGNLSRSLKKGEKYFPYWNRFSKDYKKLFGVEIK